MLELLFNRKEESVSRSFRLGTSSTSSLIEASMSKTINGVTDGSDLGIVSKNNNASKI